MAVDTANKGSKRTAKKAPAKKRGRPKKKATKKAVPKRKPGRPKKKKATKKAAPKRRPGRPRKEVELPPEGWICYTDFIQEHNISPNAMNYAIRRGRITSVAKFGKVRYFDPVKAKDEWENNVNQVQRAKNQPKEGETFGQYLEQKKQEIAEYASIDYDKIPSIEAERREKVYKAKLSEIKFLEQAGRLIEVEVVKTTWFELVRKVRDAIGQVPSRLGPELAAETSPGKLERKLATELNKVLEGLADSNGVG